MLKFNQHVVPIGQIYVTASPATGTVAQLVAPSANPNGLIIRTATVNSAASGVNLIADTAAPSEPDDYSKRIIFEFSSASEGASATIPYEIYVYPNLGLWVTNNGTVGNIWLTYDPVVPD